MEPGREDVAATPWGDGCLMLGLVGCLSVGVGWMFCMIICVGTCSSLSVRLLKQEAWCPPPPTRTAVFVSHQLNLVDLLQAFTMD